MQEPFTFRTSFCPLQQVTLCWLALWGYNLRLGHLQLIPPLRGQCRNLGTPSLRVFGHRSISSNCFSSHSILTSNPYNSSEVMQHSATLDFPLWIRPWSIRLQSTSLNSSQSLVECPFAPEWYQQVSSEFPCPLGSFGDMYPTLINDLKKGFMYPFRFFKSGQASPSQVIAFISPPFSLGVAMVVV